MIRSYLFVPGDRDRMLSRALERGADAVIVDLEDAVAPGRKAEARESTSTWLSRLGAEANDVWVRINADSNGLDDIARLDLTRFAGVVIPKATGASDLDRWASHVEGLAGPKPFIVLIETAAAVRRVDSIASHPYAHRLMMGEADLAADAGIAPDASGWHSIRTEVVLASAAAGLPSPIAPVEVSFDDPELLERSTRYFRSIGYGARALIHPNQVAPVHRAFTPSTAEVETARDILKRHEAALASGRGAHAGSDGSMVDEAVVKRARMTLQIHEGAVRETPGE